MNDIELIQALKGYKFYHNIRLTENISTKGYPELDPAQELCKTFLARINMTGKRVLDIGCRDGLFSFFAESLGALEVVAIDNDLSEGATEILIPFLNSKVKMVEMNLYDLRAEDVGLFDIAIFPGVLYHLRYPFWGLKIIRDVLQVGANLIIETAIYRGTSRKPLLYCPIGEDSPYEPTSCTYFNKRGLVDTMTSLGFEAISAEFVERKFWRRVVSTASRGGTMIDRCVFHFVYRGQNEKSNVMKYWEGKHSYHTEDK
jgi:SAM-dependent methyltransferase